MRFFEKLALNAVYSEGGIGNLAQPSVRRHLGPALESSIHA
jgi:hypothetical protein